MTCKSKKVRIMGKIRHPIMGWSNVIEDSGESDPFVTKTIDKCENQQCHDPKFERVRCSVENGEKIPKYIFEAHRDLQKKGSKEKCWSTDWREALGRQISKHNFLGMPTSSFENCSGSDDTWHTMVKTYTDVKSHLHLGGTDQAQQKEKRCSCGGKCNESESRGTTAFKTIEPPVELSSSEREEPKLLQSERVVIDAEEESSESEEEYYESRKLGKDKVTKYPSRERNQRLDDQAVFKRKKVGKGKLHRGRSKERRSSKEELCRMFEVEEKSSGPEQVWYYLTCKRSGDEIIKSPSRKQLVRVKTSKPRKPQTSPREKSRSKRRPSPESPKKIYESEEESSEYKGKWCYDDEKKGVDEALKFKLNDNLKKSLSNENVKKSPPNYHLKEFVSKDKVKSSQTNDEKAKEKIKQFKQDEEQSKFVGKDSVLVELKPSKVAQQDQAWKITSQHFKQNFAAFEESSSTTDSEEPPADLTRLEHKKEPEIKLVQEVKPQKKQFRKRRAHVQQKSVHKIDEVDMKWRIEAMINLLSSQDDREHLEDIAITVGGERFRTCRLLLVITSRFFRQQMRERNLEANIEMNLNVNVASETFAEILNWTNTGEINLNLNNIGEILYLANQLGIDSLVEKCEGMLEVLRENEGDAVCLYEYATERNIKLVANEAAELAEANFLKVVRSERFLNYTFEQVTMLLSLEDISVNSELEIFYAVWKWVIHSWDYRKRHKDSLIHHVEFENMTLDEIVILATSLIDEAWNDDNPLTWGGDGYVVDGLIRGLLKLCGEKHGEKLGEKRVDRVHSAYRKQKCGRQEAAIKIQRFYRAKKKEQIDRDYHLAEELRLSRVAQYKKNRIHKQEAATRIQRAYRGHQIRKAVRKRNVAAVTIQRYYRGYVMRKKMKEAEQAAIVIQRAYRRSKDHEKHRELMNSVSRRLQRKRETARQKFNVKTSGGGSRRGGKSLRTSTVVKLIRK